MGSTGFNYPRASAIPTTDAKEGSIIMARAVASEKEGECQLAKRCHAAGETAMPQYWEHGEETAAQVGHRKPPCEFARAERGEASFDMTWQIWLAAHVGIL